MLNEYVDELKRAGISAGALLAPEAVLEQTRLFAFHPIVRELHAFVIDDANTSDHHLLITAEPLAGSIFFLSHDGESRVVFENASTYLNAFRQAEAQGLSVPDLHPDLSPIAADQTALGDFLESLRERGESNEPVLGLIPSLDLRNMALLRRLVSDPDFFLGEAVAIEIEKRPSLDLLPIAALCAQHPHPQVARAGLLAMQRVQGLR